MIRLTIPGHPHPKQRPRVIGRYAYTPAKTREAECKIAYQARSQGIKLSAKRLKVWCVFYFKGKGHGDIDNLLKLVCDGGNKILWKDDRQITFLSGRILLNQPDEKTEISITERR